MKPRAVAIIIDHSQHRVLLIHRRNQGREYYVLPGGKIEAGETPAEACLREAREETGLHITLGARVASFTNLGRVEHYFLATGFSGKLELGFPEKGWQSAENVYELEWVSAAQLPGLALLPAEIRPLVLEQLDPAAQGRRAEQQADENANFSFIQISDHHLTPSEGEFVRGFATRYSFRAVLRHIAQNTAAQADFILSTGDLVESASERAYRAVLHMLNVNNPAAEIPGPLLISAEGLHQFPLRLLPGNHDDRDQFFKCLFPASRPTPLMNVAFMHKGIQFVCLDFGPGSKAVTHPATLQFLAQALAANLPSILVMHHQLVPVGSRWLDEFMADDLTTFWELLAGRPVLGIFCGHLHTTYECVVDGIPVFGLRSTMYSFVPQDEPLACLLPPHYRLVTVRNGLLTTQIFEVPL